MTFRQNKLCFSQKSQWSLFGFHNSLTFIALINLCFLPLARQNVACLILDCVEIKLEIIQLPTGRSAGQVSQKIYNSTSWCLSHASTKEICLFNNFHIFVHSKNPLTYLLLFFDIQPKCISCWFPLQWFYIEAVQHILLSLSLFINFIPQKWKHVL